MMVREAQRATFLVVALCAGLMATVPSYAGDDAQVMSVTQQVSSGQWGATPSTTSLPFGAQATQQLYFSVVNSGTLPLTGATYTLSGSSFKGGTTLSLLACVGGTWNTGTGACPGGQVQTVVSTTGAATTVTVTAAGLFPAAVGSTVVLQAQLDKTPRGTSVGTITVAVDRSEVRAATVTDA